MLSKKLRNTLYNTKLIFVSFHLEETLIHLFRKHPDNNNAIVCLYRPNDTFHFLPRAFVRQIQ